MPARRPRILLAISAFASRISFCISRPDRYDFRKGFGHRWIRILGHGAVFNRDWF
jgi:hypothetical protein